MAFLAALLEGAFVRIAMAVDASLELHILVTGRPSRDIWFVALLAGYLNVHAGQWIARLRMIKLLRCFPILEVVAGLALISELALVRILVTRDAVLR